MNVKFNFSFKLNHIHDRFLFHFSADPSLLNNKQFQPKETLVYTRLVKYALPALDIYTINVASSGQAYIRPMA